VVVTLPFNPWSCTLSVPQFRMNGPFEMPTCSAAPAVVGCAAAARPGNRLVVSRRILCDLRCSNSVVHNMVIVGASAPLMDWPTAISDGITPAPSLFGRRASSAASRRRRRAVAPLCRHRPLISPGTTVDARLRRCLSANIERKSVADRTSTNKRILATGDSREATCTGDSFGGRKIARVCSTTYTDSRDLYSTVSQASRTPRL